MKKAIPIFIVLVGLAVYVYFYHIRPARLVDPAVRGSGTIEVTEVVVSSKIAARITSVHAEEGDEVKSGALLATLSCEDLELRLAQARAQVVQADYGVAQARAGSKQARAVSRQARSSLRPMEVRKESAKRDLLRARKLAEGDVISKKNLDDAESAIQGIEEQLAAADDGIVVADRGVQVADKAIALAEAQVELARKNVALAEVALAECSITSPISGVVVRRSFEPGEMVLPGSAVFKIADFDEAYTWIYVANEEVGKVRIGAMVKIRADTYPERVFQGRVVRINEEAEFTPKSVQTKDDRTRLVYGVKVSVPNGDRALLAGMPVEAELTEVQAPPKPETRDAAPPARGVRVD